MADKQIIIGGVDVSDWTDEEVRYKFEKHSPKAVRQIAFDLYKQLKHYKQALNEIENVADDYNRVEKLRNIIEMVLMKYKTLLMK